MAGSNGHIPSTLSHQSFPAYVILRDHKWPGTVVTAYTWKAHTSCSSIISPPKPLTQRGVSCFGKGIFKLMVFLDIYRNASSRKEVLFWAISMSVIQRCKFNSRAAAAHLSCILSPERVASSFSGFSGLSHMWADSLALRSQYDKHHPFKN